MLLCLASTGFPPELQEDVMRPRLVGVAAVLILGGCWTPDDVKKTGVVWSGTYAARYDQLASCMSAQTTPYYKAALQFDKNEQRATVTYLIPVTDIPVEVYDIRQKSNDATEISWWTRLERGHSAYGPLYLMRLCGASPLPTTSSPTSPLPTTTTPAGPVPPQSPAWAPEPTTKTPTDR
jgi:hypothetical protein